MGVADTILSVIIFALNNTVLRFFPEQYSWLPIDNFNAQFTTAYSTFLGTFNFVENFIPLALLFSVVSVIIIAEILLHAGWKPLKWVINVFRGSGG